MHEQCECKTEGLCHLYTKGAIRVGIKNAAAFFIYQLYINSHITLRPAEHAEQVVFAEYRHGDEGYG